MQNVCWASKYCTRSKRNCVYSYISCRTSDSTSFDEISHRVNFVRVLQAGWWCAFWKEDEIIQLLTSEQTDPKQNGPRFFDNHYFLLFFKKYFVSHLQPKRLDRKGWSKMKSPKAPSRPLKKFSCF